MSMDGPISPSKLGSSMGDGESPIKSPMKIKDLQARLTKDLESFKIKPSKVVAYRPEKESEWDDED